MKFPHNTNFSQFWLLGEKSCGGEKLCKMPDPTIEVSVQNLKGTFHILSKFFENNFHISSYNVISFYYFVPKIN